MHAGIWEEAGPIHISEHAVQECCPDGLADWVELLNVLAPRDGAALITGSLRTDRRVDAYFGTWLVPSKERAHYDDPPSRWFIVDIDELHGDPDDADSNVKEFIADYLPEFDSAGVVVAFTGSAGIKGTRVRLIFELESPRTLAAQAAFVNAANARAGFEILDPSIYRPGHLVLTADPRLVAPIETRTGVTYVAVPRPLPPVRVWHVPGRLASIPDVAVSVDQMGGVAPRSMVSAAGASSADVVAILDTMAPGNFDKPIHWMVSHLAFKTPPELKDVVLDRAIAEFKERITATSEPDKLERRLRHADRARLSRKWDRAVAARDRANRPLIGAPAPTVAASTPLTIASVLAAPPRDVAAVRAQLAQDAARVCGELLAGDNKHVLVTAAPGVGKSQAERESMTLGNLTSDLVRVLTPSHKLAAQSCADAMRHASSLTADGTYHGVVLGGLIRHHKGRRQEGMCPDLVYGPKADRAERMGISPKASVCPSCPTGRSGACPWLRQAADVWPGRIYETHANMLHRDPAHDRTDLYVFDEGVLGTILASTKTGADAAAGHVKLCELLSVDVRFRRKKDETATPQRKYVTQRLSFIRERLCASLSACLAHQVQSTPVRPESAAFRWLFEGVTYKDFENRRLVDKTGSVLDEARALERQHQDSLRDQIVLADESGKRSDKLFDALRASRETMTILDTIEASQHRERVFALTVYVRGKGKQRTEYVWAERRFTGLRKLVGDRSISLDGTAVPEVWRALISPDGAPISEEIINSEPELPAGGTHTTVYRGCSGATSMFVGNDRDDDDDDERVDPQRELDNLIGASRWYPNAVGEVEYRELLARADAAAKAFQAEIVNRKKRCDSNVDQLWKFVVDQALSASRSVPIDGRSVSVLLVTTKRIKDSLLALGLPSNVATAHFGAIRGLNDFKSVPIAIIVGRNRPDNLALEMAAEAAHMYNPGVQTITRYDVKPEQGRHWEEYHPDPLVRQVQDVVTLGEVRQAVARIRAFDRTPETMCRLHVIGGYDPGLRIDEVAHWADTVRTPEQVALAAGALFARPETNQLVYPELFAQLGSGGRANQDRRFYWGHVLSELVKDTALVADLEMLVQPNSKNSGRDSDVPVRAIPTFRAGLSATHKLVKIRRTRQKRDGIRGTYGEHAVIRAGWQQAQVERHIGAKLEVFREVTRAELEIEAAAAYRPPVPFDTR
jgi:hypothetical protein